MTFKELEELMQLSAYNEGFYENLFKKKQLRGSNANQTNHILGRLKLPSLGFKNKKNM